MIESRAAAPPFASNRTNERALGVDGTFSDVLLSAQ